MDFLEIEHVQLDIVDGGEDRARAFYVDVLGMTEIPKPAALRRKGIWFRKGAVELHLDGELRGAPSATAHPGIRVRGLAALGQRCAEAGFAPRFDSRFPGRRRFYVHDPFGNRLEFFEVEDEG